MRKIIVIGESVLDTIFRGGVPAKAMVGGRIANAAASLGAMNLPVSMCSECAADGVGDMVINFFETHNVDVKSVDRFTDGSTAFSVIFQQPDGTEKIVNYGNYPLDRFDVVWPRIDENDIVIFGSLYAIDTPQRERLFDLISYAAERKAIIMYLPGFQHGINFRITKVMPSILENFEISNIVLAHERDIDDIFPGEGAEKAYRNHIDYYCANYFHINNDLSVSHFSGKNRHTYACPTAPAANMLGWQAGFAAGIVYQLLLEGITYDQIKTLDEEQINRIVETAYAFAGQAAPADDNCIPADFAAAKAEELAKAEANRE